jgi:hypothetical protein
MDEPASARESEGVGVYLVATGRLDPTAAPGAAPVVMEANLLSDQNPSADRDGAVASADATSDDPALGPQTADLIARSPAFDMEKVQTGIQNFLRELDSLGAAMITAPSGLNLSWWVLTALAAAGTCEIVRRQRRRQSADSLVAIAGEPMFSWFPEGTEASTESEA